MLKNKVDPMEGVVKSEELVNHLRSLRDGSGKSRSYVIGALKYLERKPPNPFVVPLLRKALDVYS